MVTRAIVYDEDYTIWLDNIDRPRLVEAREDKKIKCHCGKPLTFVDAHVRIPHFRHLRGNCSIIGAERDTETHNEGLEYLGQVLRKNLTGASVEKEAVFKFSEGLRRTDILVKLSDGKSICYELQCSPIPVGEYEARTEAYISLGHQVVWIFGPDSSGIKLRPVEASSKELTKGTLVALKDIAFLSLVDRDYLTLYFPELDERLWIAYCADGRFDRAKEFSISRGKQQYSITMHAVQLAFFRVQFIDDGAPYARDFPIESTKRSIARHTRRSERISTTYSRELARFGVETAKAPSSKAATRYHEPTDVNYLAAEALTLVAPTTEEELNGDHETKPKRVHARHINCTMCKSKIFDYHYHNCDKCLIILCDTCTMKIEKDLGQSEHNSTGWVSHCDWKSAFSQANR